MLPEIHPQVSIHRSSLSRIRAGSRVQPSIFPSFPPRLARPRPLFQDTGSALFPPLFTRRGNRGWRRRKGTKDTVKGVRLRAGGRMRLETRPTPDRGGGSFLSVDWKKERGCAKPSPPRSRSSTVANKEAGFRRRRDLSTSGTAN